MKDINFFKIVNIYPLSSKRISIRPWNYNHNTLVLWHCGPTCTRCSIANSECCDNSWLTFVIERDDRVSVWHDLAVTWPCTLVTLNGPYQTCMSICMMTACITEHAVNHCLSLTDLQPQIASVPWRLWTALLVGWHICNITRLVLLK